MAVFLAFTRTLRPSFVHCHPTASTLMCGELCGEGCFGYGQSDSGGDQGEAP